MSSILSLPEESLKLMEMDKLSTKVIMSQEIQQFDLTEIEKNIKAVEIMYCSQLIKVTSRKIKNFDGALHSFKFIGCPFSDLKFLTDFGDKVQNLHLEDLPNIDDYTVLMAFQLQGLQRLTLKKLSLHDLSVLNTHLIQQLRLEMIYVKDMLFLLQLPKLLSLQLIDLDISHLDLSLIQEVKLLQHLELNNLGSKHIDCEFIQRCSNLQELVLIFINLKDYSIISSMALTLLFCHNTNIESIYNLPQSLKCLSLQECRIHDLSYLNELHDIEYLNLNNCQLLDVQFVGKLKNLRKLCVANTIFQDIFILHQLKQLEYLEVGETTPLNALQSIKTLKYLKPGLSTNFRLLQALYFAPFGCIIFENQFTVITSLYLKLQAMVKLNGHNYMANVPPLSDIEQKQFYQEVVLKYQYLHYYTEQEMRIIDKDYFYTRLHDLYLYVNKGEISKQFATFDENMNQKGAIYDKYRVKCDKSRVVPVLTRNWLDDYEITEEINATQYLARSITTCQCVLIQVYKDNRPLNIDELTANKILTHQNIIKLLAVYQHFSQAALIFEYQDCVTLTHYLTTKKLDFEETFLVIAQIIFALCYINSQGIIYQSLHPDNILVLCKSQSPFKNHILFSNFSQVEYYSVELFNKKPNTNCRIAKELQPPETQTSYYPSFAIDSWQLGLLVHYLLYKEFVSQEIWEKDDIILPEAESSGHYEINGIVRYLLTRNPDSRPLASDLLKELSFGNLQKKVKLLLHAFDLPRLEILDKNIEQYLTTATYANSLTPADPSHSYLVKPKPQIANSASRGSFLNYRFSQSFEEQNQIETVLPQYQLVNQHHKVCVLLADCWTVYLKGHKVRDWNHGEFLKVTDKIRGTDQFLAFQMPVFGVRSFYQKLFLEALEMCRAHPGIPKIVDIFENNKKFLIVMENFDFITLSELLDQRSLTEEEVYIIFCQLLVLVNYCHESGVRVRNLHPDRIIINLSSESILRYHVMLFDFSNGIIESQLYRDYIKERLTLLKDYSIKYAQQYNSILNVNESNRFVNNDMPISIKAPEMLINCNESDAVDSWQLGVVLYYLCVKQFPYDESQINKLNIQNESCQSKLPEAYMSLQPILCSLLIPNPQSRLSVSDILSFQFLKGKSGGSAQSFSNFKGGLRSTSKSLVIQNISVVLLDINKLEDESNNKCKIKHYIQLVKMAQQSFQHYKESQQFTIIDDVLYSKTQDPLDFNQIIRQKLDVKQMHLSCPLIPVQKTTNLTKFVQQDTVQKSSIDFGNFRELRFIQLINIAGNAAYSLSFTQPERVEIINCDLRLDLKNFSTEYFRLERVDLEKIQLNETTIIKCIKCDVYQCSNQNRASNELKKLLALSGSQYYQ